MDLELLCFWTLSTVAYINKEHKIAENGCLYSHGKGGETNNACGKHKQLSHQSHNFVMSWQCKL
jgi:hypothetical protein